MIAAAAGGVDQRRLRVGRHGDVEDLHVGVVEQRLEGGVDARLDLAVGAARGGEQLERIAHLPAVREVLRIEAAHALAEDLRRRAGKPECNAHQDG